MKKNLTLFFAALLVVTVTSCNNVLDKKINKDTFSQDMQEIIKKDSDKYSSQDFATLMLAAGVSKMVDVQYLKGTYRQALDSIKTGREKAKADSIQKAQKYQAELKVFSDKVATLTKAIDLKVIGKGSEPVNDYDESFLFAYSITNGASQPVASFQGQVVITDLAGNPVTPIDVDYQSSIDAGKTIQYKKGYNYDSMDADQITLMNTPYDSLRFIWQPSKVVFKDGTSITAPAKPENPTE